MKQLVGDHLEWETEWVEKGKRGLSGFWGAAEAESDKLEEGTLLLSRELRGGGVSGKPKEAVPRMSSKCCRVDRE